MRLKAKDTETDKSKGELPELGGNVKLASLLNVLMSSPSTILAAQYSICSLSWALYAVSFGTGACDASD